MEEGPLIQITLAIGVADDPLLSLPLSEPRIPAMLYFTFRVEHYATVRPFGSRCAISRLAHASIVLLREANAIVVSI